jgi:hypothetical protein
LGVLFLGLLRGREEKNSKALASQTACAQSLIQVCGKLTFRLQQAQLAGPGYSFGAILDHKFAKDDPVVTFDSTQGEEKPLANLTIRESLGEEL